MKNLRFSMAWLILLLCLTPAVMAQDTLTATKEQNIRKLLAMTDAKGIFMRSIESQVAMMKKTGSQVPAKFWDEMLKEIDAGKFIEYLIPIYDKHFSDEELKSIIAFYETPAGRKLISTLPEVMAESAVAGEKYGRIVATKVVEKMKAEGTFPSTTPPE
jgi:hypothetical protein